MTQSGGPDRPEGDARAPRRDKDPPEPAEPPVGEPNPRAPNPMSVIAARLALVAPITVGVLLAEGIFAARGQSGDAVSLPAAAAAWLLAWLGIAWALRSWVAVLMTFVPALMVTLGAAMVGDLAPGPGLALICIGVTVLLVIVWSRVSAPARRWAPGWSATPDADDPDDGPTGAPARAPGGGEPDAFGRAAPSWDTSGTDRRARDALVLRLCQRGGTTGPTLASLEEFFTGNGDPRSIAPSLRGAVPLATSSAALYRLRARRDVTEVQVQLEPLEPGAYPAGEWPLAGSVRVIGAIGAEDLREAVAPLRAEEPLGPLPVDVLDDGTPAPAGTAEYAVWWE